MKVIKITKRMLKDLDYLLQKVGATYKRNAFPETVFISKQDYKILKRNLRSNLRREIPYAAKGAIDYAVGAVLLNLGPNQLLEEVIKPGYLVIDTDAIRNRLKDLGL